MVVAEAHVKTDRPGRYLDQLCRHADAMSRHHGVRHGPRAVRAARSDTEGMIEASRGRCAVRVVEDGLVLRAEADGEEDLRRIQDQVGGRLEKIGHRDGLAVAWGAPHSVS